MNLYAKTKKGNDLHDINDTVQIVLFYIPILAAILRYIEDLK